MGRATSERGGWGGRDGNVNVKEDEPYKRETIRVLRKGNPRRVYKGMVSSEGVEESVKTVTEGTE